MKRIVFLGDALDRLRGFPEGARKEAGVQLHKLQLGLEPSDWKPMASVGPGVREVRVREEGGAFRVIYLAQLPEAVYVLHAFQKKTEKTARGDLDLAGRRLRALMNGTGGG